MKDSDIVDLFFARDEKAIEQMKKKYGAYLHSVAVNVLRDERDAEECVNDGYMEIWSTVPPQKPEKLKAYAAAIVKRISINRLIAKTRKKRGEGIFEEQYEELEEVIGEEDFTSGLALRETLDSFVRTLPREAKIVFVQRYFYAMSVRQISRERKMSENAVKASLFRSRQKLKELLEKEGYL